MDQKQEIAERLKKANNILVTVSNNPSVDQLASCIGLTLVLNKMGKHAAAVFSGAVPSTIEFLQPEKTFEKNTDSLRDFIISLDKSKADKLRYKVEDKIVKIFITPYKTSITDKDLEFSQGDFNVDVVMALGVHNPGDIDQAITAHGRILHDAAVVTVNTQAGGELGSINWVDPKASSLSELVAQLVESVDKTMIDGQIATALLTGIVAETSRFSNEKTTSVTMSLSAELMAAGANQQLVATKLGEAEQAAKKAAAEAEAKAREAEMPLAKEGEGEAKPAPEAKAPEAEAGAPAVQAEAAKPVAQPLKHKEEPNNGTLEIDHPPTPVLDLNADTEVEAKKEEEAAMPQINIDDQGKLHNLAYEAAAEEQPSGAPPVRPSDGQTTTDPNGRLQSGHMILQPPSMGGQLTANTASQGDSEGGGFVGESSPLTLPAPSASPGLLQHSGATAATTPPPPAPMPEPPPVSPVPSLAPPSTPGDFTPNISSQYDPSAMPPPTAPTPAPAPVAPAPGADLTAARDAVSQAMGANPTGPPPPIQALNAQPLGGPLNQPTPVLPAPSLPTIGAPQPAVPPVAAPEQPAGPPPPPVPPPMMPPTPL